MKMGKAQAPSRAAVVGTSRRGSERAAGPLLHFMGATQTVTGNRFVIDTPRARVAAGSPLRPVSRRLASRMLPRRERADVDALHTFLQRIGAKIVHPPEEWPWTPGYHSVLFEDPDGIRLELNDVPGRGLLADVTLDP